MFAAVSSTGRYRIERLVGRGGAAEVFEASIVGLGGFMRRVAIKRLKPDVARDPSMVREFESEARLVSRLHHANVVGVLDFGTMDGLPFQVLEFVDGVDLLGLETRSKKAQIPVGSELWVAAAAEAAHGLDYVHHALDQTGRPLGLVHRDMTPSNVLVAWSGDVKVADFGIALSLEAREPTRIGVVKGKLEYLAPEALRGESADPRADVFALGCVLHRMLTGLDLLPDEPTRRRVAAGEPAPMRGTLSGDLVRLITRATSPDPQKRTPSAAAFAEDCARWLASQGVIDGRLVLRETMARLRPAPEPQNVAPLAALSRLPEDAYPGREDAYASGLATVPPSSRSDLDDTGSSSTGGAPTLVVSPLDDQPRTVLEPLRAFAEARPPARPQVSEDSSTGDSPRGLATDENEPIRLETLAWAYEILEPIAEGGFATVVRARHKPTGDIVALKTLREDRRDHKVAPARFEREAGALKKLDSPYLVRVRDSGRTPDGRPFLAMELLAGRTLADEINLMRGPLPLARTRRLARDIALGLAALHHAEIVHRDLGAKNVMVVESGGREKAMLIDLGHMRWIDDRPHTHLTAPGLMLGNSRWMAPEQVFEPSNVGPTADLYSLGLLMLAMVTGRPPFHGSPATVLRAQLETMPEIPPGPFASLIRRLIDKDPEKRVATATAVVAELTQIHISRSPEPIASPSVLPPVPLAPTPSRPVPSTPSKSAARGEVLASARTDGQVVSPRGPTEPGPVLGDRRGMPPSLVLAITAALLGILVWAMFGLLR